MSINEPVLPYAAEIVNKKLSLLTNFEFSDCEVENSDIARSYADEDKNIFDLERRKVENVCVDGYDGSSSSFEEDNTVGQGDWIRYKGGLRFFHKPMHIGVDKRMKEYHPEIRHRNPYILYRRLRRALRQAAHTDFSNKLDDPYAYELYVEFEHVYNIIFERASKRYSDESDRIEVRDMLTREKIKERFQIEKEKVLKAKESAVKELAQKMLTENDDERKQLEAELNVMGEDGEVPLNFMYVPNRKQLRRRTGHNDPNNDHPEKLDNYVPIYQVHWIDHKDIANDLEVFDSVLKSHEKPAEDRHYSVSLHEGRLIVDGKAFNRSHNQIIYIKSRSFGRFPAIILSLSENSSCLTVRSTIKGDPRHITITFNDLESGRVKLAKKPFV